ncbi:hypothetical protein ACTWLI_11335 [Arthrobacter sp. Hor0625]|uniref:hypothetical protein n=1 Tax=Arthrobacter sp. Hor0625 TaxID=3457358 RepID=UPI00403E4270
MGDSFLCRPERFGRAAALALLLSVTVSGCLAEPRQPDLSGREDFARSVMAAATSGSVERVQALVDPVMSNPRPEAQQLVDTTRGWAPDSWQLGISNDFPEVANVTATRGGTDTVRYLISWSEDHWTLVLGEPTYGPGGSASSAAKPISPGAHPTAGTSVTAQPSLTPPQAPPPAAACAGAGLTCHSFTSTSGYARGQNLAWLTSTPVHAAFDQGGGVTLVVRMPCGVLNVPVAVDDYGVVPDASRMAESADGCAGPASEQRRWATSFFIQPMVYRLDSAGLVLTNERGQIRFRQD